MSDDGSKGQWSPCHDRRGVPICAGDLIRSPHFIGARGKRHYLYHVAVFKGGFWWLIPTSWLDPSNVALGGQCLLSQCQVDASEVIDGHGPGDYLDYLDRPRAEESAS